jgi:hypothetical protein
MAGMDGRDTVFWLDRKSGDGVALAHCRACGATVERTVSELARHTARIDVTAVAREDAARDLAGHECPAPPLLQRAVAKLPPPDPAGPTETGFSVPEDAGDGSVRLHSLRVRIVAFGFDGERWYDWERVRE